MATIREGSAADIGRVKAFYTSLRRSPDAAPDDFILLAEDDDGKVVAAVRLCHESGYLILRGMLIAHGYRRQGLGKRMLRVLEPHMRDQDCFCLPYAHLEAFYGTVGFEQVADADLPDFFRARLAKYQAGLRDPEIQRVMQDELGVHPEDGLLFIVMKRPERE